MTVTPLDQAKSEKHDEKTEKDKKVKVLCMGQIVDRSEFQDYREGLRWGSV